VAEIVAHADELLLEPHHGLRGHDGAESAEGRGVSAAVADVVGTVPHQLDRLAHLLRGLGGLESGVVEQTAAERAATSGDVHDDLLHLQADQLGDLFLGGDRDLQRRPNLGPVGPDVRHGGVGLQGTMRGKGEGVLGLDHLLAWLRLELHRLRGRQQPLLDGLVRLAVLRPRAPVHLKGVDGVDALAERLAPYGDAAGNGHDIGDAGHRLDRFEVVDLTDLAVDRRRSADHRGLGVGDVEVHGEVLAPGHDGQSVDPPCGLPHNGELGFRLELDRHGFPLEDRGLGGQLPVGHTLAVRGLELARPGRELIGRVAELCGGGLRQRLLRRRRRGAHGVVKGVDGVGPAGEHVEHELRSGIRQRDVDLLQRQVHLLSDQHADRRGDALAHLGTGEGVGDRAVGVHLDLDEMRGRVREVGETVLKVVVVGALRGGRRGCDATLGHRQPDAALAQRREAVLARWCSIGAWRRANPAAHQRDRGERGPGYQVAEETTSIGRRVEPCRFGLLRARAAGQAVRLSHGSPLRRPLRREPLLCAPHPPALHSAPCGYRGQI
jgi:hypothetical protein